MGVKLEKTAFLYSNRLNLCLYLRFHFGRIATLLNFLHNIVNGKIRIV